MTAWDFILGYTLPIVPIAIAGDFAGLFPHLWWVLGYGILTMAAAVLLFLRK